MVVTDLDGTLLDSKHALGADNRQALDELGRRGVLRVVSTGRSLFSALAVLPPDTPIDFLCHSSGAGIVRWPSREALRVVNMPAEDAAVLAGELVARELDFMLHLAIPDNNHSSRTAPGETTPTSSGGSRATPRILARSRCRCRRSAPCPRRW